MRPIDADALDIFRVEEDGIHQWREIVNQMVSDIQSLAPVIDVVPVVHGKWVFADDGYLRCSECTQKAPVVQPYDDEPTTTATNYCPYCGAMMDLEV